jgi:Clp amino terminal domain, pathogenicity island component/UvrB/uvrC motif
VFERFSDQARRVVALAQEEARGLDHGYIGTEHLLLGLLRTQGAACQALESSGITSAVVLQQVESLIGRGDNPSSGHIPFTPQAKEVLQLAMRETGEAGGEPVRGGHILLGILRQGAGVAIQVITAAGADPAALRTQVTELLQDEPRGKVPQTVHAVSSKTTVGDETGPMLDAIEARLDAIEERLGIPFPEVAALREATARLGQIREAKQAAIDTQDYEHAAALREQEKKTMKERARLREALRAADAESEGPEAGHPAG